MEVYERASIFARLDSTSREYVRHIGSINTDASGPVAIYEDVSN